MAPIKDSQIRAASKMELERKLASLGFKNAANGWRNGRFTASIDSPGIGEGDWIAVFSPLVRDTDDFRRN